MHERRSAEIRSRGPERDVTAAGIIRDDARISGIMAANATSSLTATLLDRRMAEIRTVTTLVKKRDEIRATIRMYEKKIAQALFTSEPA